MAKPNATRPVTARVEPRSLCEQRHGRCAPHVTQCSRTELLVCCIRGRNLRYVDRLSCVAADLCLFPG